MPEYEAYLLQDFAPDPLHEQFYRATSTVTFRHFKYMAIYLVCTRGGER